ncbi:MAG: hypothetical protein L7F77_02465 [Candidatus Magnetominusculus sp. LBB02]|nr:hypothetical protein [Candidatus Magnetominusculus sp. LBB02]
MNPYFRIKISWVEKDDHREIKLWPEVIYEFIIVSSYKSIDSYIVTGG